MSKITVYTTNSCPYCMMMTSFLKEQGLPFKEVNIQEDPVAANFLVNTTGQMGVPQTEVNGQWVLGYDPDQIMKLVK